MHAQTKPDTSYKAGISKYSSVDYFNWGIEKYKKKKYKAAIEYFTKSLEITPKARTYFYCGAAKFYRGDWPGATEEFTKAIELDTTHSDYYFNRAICKSRMNNYKGAMEDYEKAAKLKSQSWAFDNNYLAKSRMERRPDPFVDYTKLKGTNPYDSKVFADRAVKEEQQGKYEEAIKDYSEAIEEYTLNAGAFYGRGNCKYNLKDFEGAKEDYTKAIHVNNRFAKAYFNRANAEYNLGEKDKAFSDWKKASKLGITEADDILAKLDKPSAAKKQ